MPRPKKRRILQRVPHPAVYKPAGIPLNDLRLVTLLHEELEALRLADLEELSQAQAASNMGVSRSTFQRMLANARRQVSLALVEGCALQVVGGSFDVAVPARRRSYNRVRNG